MIFFLVHLLQITILQNYFGNIFHKCLWYLKYLFGEVTFQTQESCLQQQEYYRPNRPICHRCSTFVRVWHPNKIYFLQKTNSGLAMIAIEGKFKVVSVGLCVLKSNHAQDKIVISRVWVAKPFWGVLVFKMFFGGQNDFTSTLFGMTKLFWTDERFWDKSKPAWSEQKWLHWYNNIIVSKDSTVWYWTL